MNLYQDHILDHYHNPRNWGQLELATHLSDVKNPTCGDALHFELQVKGEIVEGIAWTGEGCAISLASASLLSEKIVGKTISELLTFTPSTILELLGLPLSPARVKCGILSLEALSKALINKK
jgi:nitrogen fixation protein NifU and related proteins